MTTPKDLKRIGVFYDGNYFLHVSNYYNYFHARRKRLNIAGLHDFIRNLVAKEEEVPARFCQVIEAHYFRGRISAQEASQRGNQLYNDRVFDDILMSEGVVTHYLPIRNRSGKKEEKGIDVWLALEAFEQAFYKRFNVVVLITSDGDYVPLIRKLNSLGAKVMVLSWDFEYTDDMGRDVVTRTSQDLIQEVTYPIAMHELINNGLNAGNQLVTNLFELPEYSQPKRVTSLNEESEVHEGSAMNMNNGYGFIQFPPNNLFFHYQDVVEGDFNEINNGDMLEFTIETNERGQEVAKNVRKAGHVDTEPSDPNLY
ncbi:MAG: NYN domain-containing protein [Bacteroidales bacterium]|nr:NYN domain-containing protein [Bacteroidales bacterium]MDD4671436.1 NYN domain-containing protein [Bacteroidales bacterium]MDY0347529.1 NYN domain-containing protein [Tenuifilaceae bacterium]